MQRPGAIYVGDGALGVPMVSVTVVVYINKIYNGYTLCIVNCALSL